MSSFWKTDDVQTLAILLFFWLRMTECARQMWKWLINVNQQWAQERFVESRSVAGYLVSVRAGNYETEIAGEICHGANVEPLQLRVMHLDIWSSRDCCIYIYMYLFKQTMIIHNPKSNPFFGRLPQPHLSKWGRLIGGLTRGCPDLPGDHRVDILPLLSIQVQAVQTLPIGGSKILVGKGENQHQPIHLECYILSFKCLETNNTQEKCVRCRVSICAMYQCKGKKKGLVVSLVWNGVSAAPATPPNTNMSPKKRPFQKNK